MLVIAGVTQPAQALAQIMLVMIHSEGARTKYLPMLRTFRLSRIKYQKGSM